MSDIKRFTFRLPNDLFDRINSVANDNHRSVNAEIIVAIEKYLQSLEVSQETKDN